MKYLIKETIKPLYFALKDKNTREFNRLYDKYGNYERYKKINNVKFLNFVFDIPDLQSFVWQFKDLFVNNSYKFNSSSTTPTIIDCGANIGTSCLYFKTLYPNAKITAFEADENIAKILKSNLLKNNINDVKVVSSAVWINEDGVSFACDGADGGHIQADNNNNKISSIRLKTVLDNSKNKIDLLKIDIEGAEYDVIKDCKTSLDNVENILIEYHSWNNTPQKLSTILEVLELNGFRYYIEGFSRKKYPFINNDKEQNMDLQLNIWGVKNEQDIKANK